MLSVEKISVGFRDIGLNYGLPMTFVDLGDGPEMSSDDLLGEILKTPGCNWVCVRGKDTTQSGMGAFIKNLSKMSLYTEVENDGKGREPGWVHNVDRWMVDFVEECPFNYFSLRKEDMVLLDMEKLSYDLLQRYLDALSPFAGTRCVKASAKDRKNPDFIDIVRKQSKCRIY